MDRVISRNEHGIIKITVDNDGMGMVYDGMNSFIATFKNIDDLWYIHHILSTKVKPTTHFSDTPLMGWSNGNTSFNIVRTDRVREIIKVIEQVIDPSKMSTESIKNLDVTSVVRLLPRSKKDKQNG